MIRLGAKVRDKVTGLTGIVVCRSEWLHGCVRIVVQPQELKDGKPVESSVFDEPSLEVIENVANVTPPPSGGGGRDDGPALSRR